ncbi:MAG: CBS domain-containing protein [Chloroflexi bacterium]|nr:CBS domain-containing protein [Chloroflexota bacterium]MBU1746482.1 CBS domain-containing protein [Chloroflexota bacterium]
MEIIITHSNTDFDGLAAMLAAAKLYPGTVPVLPPMLNRNLRDFLALYRHLLPFVEARDIPKHTLIQRVILVDTQTAPPMRGLDDTASLVIIDHHPLKRELRPGDSYTGEELGATTTLLVERIAEAQIALTPVEATLLLLGIYEDTGCLRYGTTTPRDLQAAAWLLAHGASLAVLNDFLYRPFTPRQRAVYEDLERHLEIHDYEGRAVLIATAQVAGYVEELAALAHKVMDLYDPAACFLIIQLDRHLQIIARSQTDAIDVAAILRPLGGGGHTRAASALQRDADLTTIHRRLLDLLDTHVQPDVTAAELMSRNVQTLSPQDTVQHAAEMMQRFGHEGFPVVDEHGALAGILTRREIDKALYHDLGAAPIRVYMRTDPIAVPLTASANRIRQLMMEYDVGQIPVVEDDQVIGIVTRTDVIRLSTEPAAAAPSLTAEIQDVLPAPALALMRHVGHVADELGYQVYLVGGFVRDLLLHTVSFSSPPVLDLDLVVEGNAIALAQCLAAELGGRVRSHERFGTAKWLLAEERPAGPPGTVRIAGETWAIADLPPAIDLVTARTEFYEHPTALPEVRASSIKRDLYRRDFTINTMALRLNADQFGELVDFYGGRRDLERRLIRVLHNLSFVEDATRILRAVRFEQRLSFHIEERTEELILDAVGLLRRVSPKRIRQELELILEEREPERALARLAELGVLAHLHPALVVDDWLQERFVLTRWEAPAWNLSPSVPIYLGLLTYRMTRPELTAFIDRVRPAARDSDLLRSIHDLQAALPSPVLPVPSKVEGSGAEGLTARDLPPSRVARQLRPQPTEALFVTWIASGDEMVRARLRRYHDEWQHIRSILSGEYLRAQGIPPGPAYRRVLEALLDARLDGTVTTEDDERVFIARALDEAREPADA